MNNNLRSISFAGIFIALIMGVGYALAVIPNVELVTAIIFLAGILMGKQKGLIIGILGEFMFSALNPFGSGLLFPPMLIAQILAMGLTGFCGGFFSSLTQQKPTLKHNITVLLSGTILTTIYDIFVSAAYPLASGFTLSETAASIIAGLGFSFIHIVANSIIFLVVIPPTALTIYHAVPYFQQLNSQKSV